MSLQADSKIYRFQNKTVVYIPKEIVNDSKFPFNTSTTVHVEIAESGLVITGGTIQ